MQRAGDEGGHVELEGEFDASDEFRDPGIDMFKTPEKCRLIQRLSLVERGHCEKGLTLSWMHSRRQLFRRHLLVSFLGRGTVFF